MIMSSVKIWLLINFEALIIKSNENNILSTSFLLEFLGSKVLVLKQSVTVE